MARPVDLLARVPNDVWQAAVEQQESGEPTSPLEEIAAAANLPANPEVEQKAAAELMHIPHDLPLTVNEPVLTFLNFFQTTRGRKIIETIRGL